ncbi:hypothetical protein HME9304_01636 [Flagellimonas maritima]|uniref:Uncharacterized protein n=1 Tax=Flagellimonas maritima TaxID=1383885 RepID=A0A2Z4LS27_9FLAO|nr:hypothetical protein HME9304_01636 [Allomuricauda aurantiaca]
MVVFFIGKVYGIIRYYNVRNYDKTLLIGYICMLFRINPSKND